LDDVVVSIASSYQVHQGG